LIVHRVGNKTHKEILRLSDDLLNLENERLKELLVQYFLKPMIKSELYRLTFSNKDFKMNPIYQFAHKFFEENGNFKTISIDIAKYLYDTAIHQNIKKGDLFIASFKNVILDGDMVEAIGIFKSENRVSFLKLIDNEAQFNLNYDEGIGIDKLDKGCLIFNIKKNNGYKVCMVDQVNKGKDAQFWSQQFLNITPFENDYHYTKEFLNTTQNYVSERLSHDFEVSKVDKIDLLNRSVDYFKTNEQFEKEDFEQIARFLKSVLKLDKNFHVYIHGDRSQIEQGIEADGRKFYKLYYKDER